MRYRVSASLLLAIVISLFGVTTSASPQTNESYDGTINSFRWLKNPISVGEVQIRNEQGERIALSRFNGKIVLLNLWASWCPPCVKELPSLDRLQQRLGGEDFTIVTVSLDDDSNLAQQMFAGLSIQSLVFFSETTEQLGRHFPIDVLPTTILINRESQAMGLLRSSLDWDSSMPQSLMNRLIAGVSAATLRAEKAQQQPAE